MESKGDYLTFFMLVLFYICSKEVLYYNVLWKYHSYLSSSASKLHVHVVYFVF